MVLKKSSQKMTRVNRRIVPQFALVEHSPQLIGWTNEFLSKLTNPPFIQDIEDKKWLCT